METTQEKARVDVRIEPLRGLALVLEIVGGVGRTLGLTLLWGLEIVRDSYFRQLGSSQRPPAPQTRERVSSGPAKETTHHPGALAVPPIFLKHLR